MEKFEKKEYYEIDTGEIDDLAEKHYGIKEFCWEATMETNDGYSKTELDGVIEDGDLKTEKALRNGESPMWSGHVLLNMLAKDGHIPKGNYLIDHTH